MTLARHTPVSYSDPEPVMQISRIPLHPSGAQLFPPILVQRSRRGEFGASCLIPQSCLTRACSHPPERIYPLICPSSVLSFRHPPTPAVARLAVPTNKPRHRICQHAATQFALTRAILRGSLYSSAFRWLSCHIPDHPHLGSSRPRYIDPARS